MQQDPAAPSKPDPQTQEPLAEEVVLPYNPRPGQRELAARAFRAFREGAHAVLEAGTGTGKTVAVLSAALAATRRDGRRVIWLTRTNAQARQVLVELKAIRDDPDAGEAAGAPVLAVAMQGRHHLCPQLRQDARYAGADAEEYARLCARLKRATPRDEAHPGWGEPSTDPELHESGGSRLEGRSLPVASQGCPYYQGLLQSDPDALADRLMRDPLDAQEFAAYLERNGVCPYEAAKGVLKQARLVVAPYVYLADRRLHKAMSEWLGAPLSECLVVVDEAHNLPDYLREVNSVRLSRVSLERAMDEAKSAGDPELAPGVRASRFVHLVDEALEQVSRERLEPGQEDGNVRREDLTVGLLSPLRMATSGLVGLLNVLEQEGERVRDEALRKGRLPRSYLSALAIFLSAWLRSSPGEHVPLVERGPPLRFVLFCLDPSFAGSFLEQVHGSVHVSGTLRPLEAHRDLLGLPPGTDCASFPSPYPKENLRFVLVDEVTTQYDRRNRDPAMMDKLADHVASFAGVKGVNAMVLFPSHSLLAETRELALAGVERRMFVESPEWTQKELNERLQGFRDAGRLLQGPSDDSNRGSGKEGALWAGVIGGRVSEGMDFPGRTLEALCLVGVPYPRPTARHEALTAFNEIRFGKGWEYTVQAPTFRRVMQAVGRVVRDASDQGIVFLLDHRYRRWAHELGRLERLGDEEMVAGVLEKWSIMRDDR